MHKLWFRFPQQIQFHAGFDFSALKYFLNLATAYPYRLKRLLFVGKMDLNASKPLKYCKKCDES